MSEENKAVTKTTEKEAVITEQTEMNYPALFAAAMQNEKAMEIIERLEAMQVRQEDRRAKKEFDLHFAEMQAEFKPVVKDREGSKTNSGKVAFKYAPIESYQEVNDPIIAKHGFSYKWTEEPLENGELRTRIHISGWGHTDSESKTDIPPIATNSLTTAAQARGAQKGYGRRITYVDGFGMTAIGEDTDGALSFDDGLKYGDLQLKLDECKTLEELQNESQMLYSELKNKNDTAGIEVLRKLKIKRKGELT